MGLVDRVKRLAQGAGHSQVPMSIFVGDRQVDALTCEDSPLTLEDMGVIAARHFREGARLALDQGLPIAEANSTAVAQASARLETCSIVRSLTLELVLQFSRLRNDVHPSGGLTKVQVQELLSMRTAELEAGLGALVAQLEDGSYWS